MSGRSDAEPVRMLLVEDDLFKEERLEEAMRSVHPNCSIAVGRTVQQAVSLIEDAVYDIIVLDMALPSHESKPGGAQPISQPSGGVEVLLELSYERRDDRVVIVTQYPEIEYEEAFYPLAKFPKALRKKLKVNLAAVIYFSTQNVVWRRNFEEAIR